MVNMEKIIYEIMQWSQNDKKYIKELIDELQSIVDIKDEDVEDVDIKIGDTIIFNVASDDEDLEEWLCDDNNGIKHKITNIDYYAKLFWIANCPYAIHFDDNFDVEVKE